MFNQFGSLPSLTSGIPTIGLIHGDIVPRTPYHPVTPWDFEKGADAWVVGHVHGPQAITAIAHYPGSPQAFDYGMGEQGPHGFKWLTFEPTAKFSDLQPISTVQFQDAELSVEPGEDESHWDAAIRVGEDFAKAIRADQPDLQSVQLRARAVFTCGGEKLRLPESHDMSQDGYRRDLLCRFSHPSFRRSVGFSRDSESKRRDGSPASRAYATWKSRLSNQGGIRSGEIRP